MESIKLENIWKDYHRGKIDIPVLKGVSLTVARGEMVALMGASGSGKTTLVNILGSLDVASSGRYWLEGEEISELSEKQRALLRNQTIGFVFQSFNLLPRLTALENVMMPLGYASRGLSDRECRERAREMLGRVGLGDRLDHQPTQLSGGEQQRVAIARALANRCSLLIADEPTGNLDSKTGEEILQIFQQLNTEDGLTIILVTHDPTVAAHAGRIVRIHDGVIVPDPEDDGRPDFIVRRPKALGELGPEFESGAWPVHERAPRSGMLNHLRFFVRTTAMALRSLRRNVMRSVLTTLGIIIGVASLIAIAEIGKGSASAIKQILTNMGANSLMIEAGAASSNGVSLGSGTIKTLTPEDAEAIGNECPSVNSLAPIVYTRCQVIYGNKNWIPIDIHGTTPGLLRVRDWEVLAEGEPFTMQDVHDIALVCMLGQTLVHELFEDESPIGREVYVNDVPLRVIGVLSRKGTNIIGVDQDDILLAPWTTIKYRVSAASSPHGTRAADANDPGPQIATSGRRFPRAVTALYPTQSLAQIADTPRLERFSNVDFILARAQSTEEIPAAMAQIAELLRERHQLG
ncbi:MAG: ATP-binding cassette domain-containing protein, partial [Planctomycetaceae bacterium]|nr:ATP-binding cassette domain-containing protein [Planctomycetaceae bacterium]